MERGGKNYFLLNVNQTREVVIDLRRKTMASRLLSVLGQDVDVTEERKVPGHLHRQQAELEYKQRSCAQKKGDEQVLLPKEAEILLCVQENDGDFLFYQ